MARKYNLASKSDMRRLTRDIEHDFKKQVKQKLPKTPIAIACPHCNSDINATTGRNTCPYCHNVVNVNYDLSNL